MTNLLASFKDNRYMWDGFAGAESWSEDLQPLFASIDYPAHDGCLLVADKKGIQVFFFDDYGSYAGETWSMLLEEQSYEFVLPLSLGVSAQLNDFGHRLEARRFLEKAGFILV